jgi:hypothetical protein
MKRFVLFLAVVAALAACSSYSYLRVARLNPAQMQKVSDAELCNAYFQARAEPMTTQVPIREEMKARGILTEQEWQLVVQHRIGEGMSRLALIACWGYPKRMTRELAAPGDSLATAQQYIYEGSSGVSTISVYLEQDVVTSWREWSEVTRENMNQFETGDHSRASGVVTEPRDAVQPMSDEPQKGVSGGATR